MKSRSPHCVSASARCARIAIALLTVAAALPLAACSSSVDRRADSWGGEGSAPSTPAQRQPHSPSQGGSWELVFATPGVSARIAGAEEGPEYSRNDAALNPRPAQVQTALSNWPEPARPSLLRARSVRVRDTESTFIYYLPRGETGGGGGSRGSRSDWWY